eukprot:11242720-Alexandrium_andersonii.AAC.1
MPWPTPHFGESRVGWLSARARLPRAGPCGLGQPVGRAVLQALACPECAPFSGPPGTCSLWFTMPCLGRG